MGSDDAVPLVTGATGFAGSHLVERLLESHPRIAAWSHRVSAAGDFGGRVEWSQVDLLDPAAVRAALRQRRPSVIYHCAGLAHVAESWRHAERSLQVNAMGTHHLLEAVRGEAPATPTLVVGSALVYRPSLERLSEESPLAPADPYGTSKLAQEMIALKAETPTFLARPFNHAGPRQQAAFVTSSFARQIAEIEAGLAPPRLLVGNLDARRDMTDVRDTVRAYAAIVASGALRRPYNVCSGTAHRIGDLLEHLLRLARVPIAVEQDPSRLRPSDNPVVAGDPSRITTETGWRATIPIETTLADLLGWWRQQLTRARQ